MANSGPDVDGDTLKEYPLGSDPLMPEHLHVDVGSPKRVTQVELENELSEDGEAKMSEWNSVDAPPEVRRDVLHPEGKFRRRWDSTQAVLLIYIAISVPLRVGFRQSAMGYWYWLETSMDLFFTVDIVLNFYTAFCDKDTGVLVIDRRKIASTYLKNWFTIDCIACLPLDMTLRALQGTLECSFYPNGCSGDSEIGGEAQVLRLFRLLRLFRMMKLLRLARMNRILQRFQDDLFNYATTITICKYIIVLLYLGHFFGCFFYYFSTDEWRTQTENDDIEAGRYDVWQNAEFCALLKDDGNLQCNATLANKYIASMYWAFTTMTTVGYGDISAKTMMERVWAILGMVVGGFVFSLIVAGMNDVMASGLLQRIQNERTEQITAFIKDNRICNILRKDMLAYFRNHLPVTYDTTELMHSMPYHLRKRTVCHIYRDVIETVPFIRQFQHRAVFLVSMLSHANRLIVEGGHVLYEMEEESTSLYIIRKGVVSLLASSRKTELPAGSYFGEGCVCGSDMRDESVLASGRVELLALKKDHMLAVLTRCPEIHDTVRLLYESRKRVWQQSVDERNKDLMGFMKDGVSPAHYTGSLVQYLRLYGTPFLLELNEQIPTANLPVDVVQRVRLSSTTMQDEEPDDYRGTGNGAKLDRATSQYVERVLGQLEHIRCAGSLGSFKRLGVQAVAAGEETQWMDAAKTVNEVASNAQMPTCSSALPPKSNAPPEVEHGQSPVHETRALEERMMKIETQMSMISSQLLHITMLLQDKGEKNIQDGGPPVNAV